MRFRLTFVTTLALIFMAAGLYLVFADLDGAMGKRYFLVVVGILAWIIGNQLADLEDRLTELEKKVAGENSPAPASREQPTP